MPANSQAIRLNLDYYRKQAKVLLKTARSGDRQAVERVTLWLPETELPLELALHHAQFTIAREQGFSSWRKFKEFIVRSAVDFAAAFVEAALSDLTQAERMLGAHPEMGDADFYTALVLGNLPEVEKRLKEDPAVVNTPGGPRKWTPLLYVCFSRFANGNSNRAGDMVKTAQLLLGRGADPNAAFISRQWPDNPLPCLYGATGVNNNPALAIELLRAGAGPNDSESLYHSTEHADLACLKLLLENGASPAGTNALKHMLDREDIRGLGMLLEAGADPNEVNGRGETALHWAVSRGRGAVIVNELIDRGVELNALRSDGRTAYAMAAQSGQSDIAALLKARGADTELSDVDSFLAASPVQGTSEAPEIGRSPENERLMPDLASNHRTAAVRALLAAGMPVDARGELGATALHWSCWKGYADLVQLLLEHGASLTIRDEQFQAVPAGWFAHGLQNCDEDRGDYPQVARLLFAAGATLANCDIPTGNTEVDEVLREYGVIAT